MVDYSVFTEKAVQPNDKLIAEALGKKYPLWQGAIAIAESICGPITQQWMYHGRKYGWYCKLLHKKKNILFMAPLDGYFRIVFLFNDQAVSEIEASDAISDTVKEDLRNGEQYNIGRSLNVNIKFKKNLADIRQLIEIKGAK
ncbi:MAG: DUF3788 family protein [Candidatus Zixiibacteriota bacterium]